MPSLDQAHGREGRDRRFERVIISTAAIVVALGVAATVYPASFLWGIHSFGFLPSVAAVVAFALMVIVFIPLIRSWVIAKSERFLNRVPDSFSWRGTAIGIVLMAALFWILRERLFLLGDGALYVRTLPRLASAADIPTYFISEPLSGWLSWKMWQILSFLGVLRDDAFPVQLVNILCGTVSVALTLAIAKALDFPKTDRWFFAAFILASGVSQFFFGYVEHYSRAHVFLLLFVWLSVLHLRGTIRLVYPAIAYGVLFVTHFGMLSFLPALLFLYTRGTRTRPLQTLVAVVALPSTVALLLAVCGYEWGTFSSVLFGGQKHILSLGSPDPIREAYSMLSIPHLIDFLNLQLLVSPFMLILLAIVPALFGTGKIRRDSALVFLIILAVNGVGFAFLLNPEVGMSRDWDLLSTFSAAGVVAAAAMTMCVVENQRVRRTAVFVMSGIMAVQTAGWISLNATEEPALRRFESLPDSRLWGKWAMMSAYEELAIFHRTRKDGLRASEYYEKYLAIDSTNARIWGSYAYLRNLMNDERGEAEAYGRAVQLGSRNPEHHAEFGMLLMKHREFGRAAEVFARAESLGIARPDLYVMWGAASCEMMEFDKAMSRFERAIAIDSGHVDAYLGAARVQRQLGDYGRCKEYLRKALALTGDGPGANVIRIALKGLEETSDHR